MFKDFTSTLHELLSTHQQVRPFMQALLAEHAARLPDVDWEFVESIDVESELAWLRDDWFNPLIEEDPPGASGELAAVWFGLYSPSLDGEPSHDMYVGGSKRFALDQDWDWAAYGRIWSPDGRCARSSVLAALCQAGDDEGFDPQHLSLGYAVITAAKLMEQADPELFGARARPVGVAVGWDSGHPVYIGLLQRSGFRRRDAAEAIARAAAYNAAFDASFDP